MLNSNIHSSEEFLPDAEEKKDNKLLFLCCLREVEIQGNWVIKINLRIKKDKKKREKEKKKIRRREEGKRTQL